LKDELGLDPAKMTLEKKMAAQRKWRTDRYEQLTDAVYKRRGWTAKGVPTLDRIAELGIDFPQVLEVVKPLL
jgi:aldehyde:ferredoxin oxidoreductase